MFSVFNNIRCSVPDEGHISPFCLEMGDVIASLIISVFLYLRCWLALETEYYQEDRLSCLLPTPLVLLSQLGDNDRQAFHMLSRSSFS